MISARRSNKAKGASISPKTLAPITALFHRRIKRMIFARCTSKVRRAMGVVATPLRLDDISGTPPDIWRGRLHTDITLSQTF